MTTPVDHIQSYLANLQKVLRELPLAPVAQMLALFERAHAEERTVFVIGNGGSAATASHMMNDLCKGPLGHDPAAEGSLAWKRFRVLALTDNVPLLTAWANDAEFNSVFSEPLQNFARAGDVLLAISASGNSPNILAAVDVARRMKLQVVGFTGFGGGKLAQLADLAIVVPSNEYGPVEDVHLVLDHILTSYLHAKLKAGQGS